MIFRGVPVKIKHPVYLIKTFVGLDNVQGQHTLFKILDIQGDFFNWPPPKNHKYGKKLKYLNWDPPKSSKCQPVSKFWHLELLWWDLLCNLTLRTFWGGPSSYLDILGGSQFECSTYFTYRKKLVIFRGVPVKKTTLYIKVKFSKLYFVIFNCNPWRGSKSYTMDRSVDACCLTGIQITK